MSCACWRVFLSQLPGAKRRQKTGFRALLARPRHTPPTPPQRCPHTNRDTFSLQMSNKSELAQQRVRRFNRMFSALGGAALSIACSARLHAALSAPSSPFHNATANNMRSHRHPPPLPRPKDCSIKSTTTYKEGRSSSSGATAVGISFRGSACPVHRVTPTTFHKNRFFAREGP